MIEEILARSSEKAAPLLLGWILVRETPQGKVKLKIVETEAYHQDDPASHSFRGLTKRTAPMFEAGGLIYVYFTYGAHYCINIVTGPKGTGEAILLRAAEPLEGVEIMQQNRGSLDIYNLASGPGKLTQALGAKRLALKILLPLRVSASAKPKMCRGAFASRTVFSYQNRQSGFDTLITWQGRKQLFYVPARTFTST
jgi:DNA-3-methyladenine glycosylase